jgi:hypothetical protein
VNGGFKKLTNEVKLTVSPFESGGCGDEMAWVWRPRLSASLIAPRAAFWGGRGENCVVDLVIDDLVGATATAVVANAELSFTNAKIARRRFGFDSTSGLWRLFSKALGGVGICHPLGLPSCCG